MINTNLRASLFNGGIGATPRLKPEFMREQELAAMEDSARVAQLQRQMAGPETVGEAIPQAIPAKIGINAGYGDSAQRGGAPKLGFGATAGSPSFYKPRRGNSITGYAKGGHVKAGQTILVGEEGPEIMRVKKDAEIIPNHRVSSFYKSRAKKGKKC